MSHVIENLTVIAKEWFDKVNGNSYFSAEITVGHKGITGVYRLPFQYGYDSMYIQQTFTKLKEHGFIVGENWNIQKYCRENNIPAVFTKHENCLNRDVKAWGKSN